MEISKIILAPIVTEASTAAVSAFNQYSFKVNPLANKYQIQHAIEQVFGVTIEKVRVLSVHAKTRRFGKRLGKTSSWKKAIVTLPKGQKIEFAKGV